MITGATGFPAEQRPIGDYTTELRRLPPEARVEVSEELGSEPRYMVESGLAGCLERVRSAPDVTGR